MASIERWIGGPGTGKTRLIQGELTASREALGLSTAEVGCCTFTRAGRAELSERVAASWGCEPEALTKHGWFRTAHSIAFKQAQIEEGRLLEGGDGAEWVSDAVGQKIVAKRSQDGGTEFESGEGDNSATLSLKAWELARQTMTTLSSVIELWSSIGDDAPMIREAESIVRKYEIAKTREGRLDFTDLVSLYAGIKHCPQEGPSEVQPVGDVPESLRVLAIDEAQDSSAIVDRICRRLASSPNMERVLIVGDPYQCQPAGTPVLTDSGYKKIEDIDSDADRVVSYSKKEARVYRKARFQKAWREVDSSELFEITFADGTKSVCTRNHQWLVRTNRRKSFATYLMRKGNRFRVGTVQMFANHKPELTAKSGDFRFKMRMNQEDADAGWVLKVFDTDREARVYEQIVSFRFGIPQVTFKPPSGCKSNLDREFIECVFSTLGDLTPNAERCLASHSLSLDLPFLVKGDRAKNGGKACRKTYASNLIPGIHSAPRLTEGGIDWVEVDSLRRFRGGESVVVYSLNVEKHHTYVTANGIITGNSIFGFGGSDFRHFLSWDAEEKTMEQSFRCPDIVMRLGESCIRQMRSGYRDRGIKPATHAGRIEHAFDVTDAISRIQPDKSTLILGRCAFSLAEYEAELTTAGIPYSWIDASPGGSALSGYRALWDLEHGEVVSGQEWAAAIAILAVKHKELGKLLHHGEKTAWAKGNRSDIDLVLPVPEYLEKAGCEQPLIDLIRAGRWAEAMDTKHAAKAEAWRRCAVSHGPELATSPKTRLSTIHSAKGCEGDTVILSTISSKAVETARLSLSSRWDEECRVNYVAVTRARENLIVVDDGGKYRLELP